MGNEHFALVVIEKPDIGVHEENMKWISFLTLVPHTQKKPAPSYRLHECVWLFDLRNELLEFAVLVTGADKSRLPYKVRLFPTAPTSIDSQV